MEDLLETYAESRGREPDMVTAAELLADLLAYVEYEFDVAMANWVLEEAEALWRGR